MTLSRRDRAAMQLALGLLRTDELPPALEALCLGDAQASTLANEAYLSRDFLPEPWRRDVGSNDRLVRARLALALRAMLRADRGDYGRLVCACFGEERDAETGDGRYCRFKRPRRYTALWSQAPATGTTTRPAGLRRRDESAGTPSRAGGV